MKIHHVGIVVSNIIEHFEKHIKVILPHSSLSKVYEDPIQKVKVAFIDLEEGRLELVEPLGDNSPVSAFLSKNSTSFHHVCFQVKDISDKLQDLKSKGAIIVSPANPAVAFEGRKVAFVLTRDKLLWELLEWK